MSILAAAGLVDLLTEALGSSDGAERFDRWLQSAVDDATPPPPIELIGPGSEALTRLLLHRLTRAGVDALGIPLHWIGNGRAEKLEPRPAVAVVLGGLEILDSTRLGRLARRSALLLAGDFGAAVDGTEGGSIYLSLTTDRAEDLALYAAALA